MILLEYQLQKLKVNWLKMKIYDEKEIAVACYRPQKKSIPKNQKRKIVVAVFVPAISVNGDETAAPLEGTIRKFLKKDRKIADWYFRELCRLYKNGITHARDERREFSFGFD